MPNLVIRMAKILTEENGYEKEQFKKKKEKRRTEAELD